METKFSKINFNIISPIICIALILTSGCFKNSKNFDASGLFEAEETIVSSEIAGKLIKFNIDEGSLLTKDSIVAEIDPLQYELQIQQVEASIQAVQNKNIPISPQIKILEAQILSQKEQVKSIQIQLQTAKTEKSRIEKLIQGDAAPGKQLDDIKAQIELLEQQIRTIESQINVSNQQIRSQSEILKSQNTGISSEKGPLEKRKEQALDILKKSKIKNPVEGVVLSKFVNENEVVGPAKPLYKIANMSHLKLKAYVSGEQLSKIQLNQQVKVYTDFGEKEQKEYSGQIVWISDKAEFTPKTIQTKEERVNLVYAIKIKVVNDGYLKLGMYGEVKFDNL